MSTEFTSGGERGMSYDPRDPKSVTLRKIKILLNYTLERNKIQQARQRRGRGGWLRSREVFFKRVESFFFFISILTFLDQLEGFISTTPYEFLNCLRHPIFFFFLYKFSNFPIILRRLKFSGLR